MTCVVGMIKRDGKLIMGADSVASDWLEKINLPTPKVLKRDGLLIGACGEMTILQVIKYHLVIPKRKQNEDDERYVVTKLVPALRKAFRENNITLKQDEKEFFRGSLLIGCGKSIFQIECSFNVIRSTENFLCIGSGGVFARSSLLTSHIIPKMTTIERLRLALRVASKCARGVGGKLTIVESD